MMLLMIGAFLLAFGVIAWAFIVVLLTPRIGSVGKWIYSLLMILLGVLACWSTLDYKYKVNADTEFHGWPVPVMILQRDDANSPWLDFVGPTVILGLPMNFAIFTFFPSAAFLSLAYWKTWRSRRTIER